MKITKELSDAYYRTDYSVFLNNNEKLTLFASGYSEHVRDFLLSHHVESCAFITAYNPESKLLRDAENTRRHADLLAYLGGKWQLYLGEGVSKTSDWPAETSILILGITLAGAREVAFKYNQNAFVFGNSTGKTELIATLLEQQENLIHPLARMHKRLGKKLNAKKTMSTQNNPRVTVNFVSARKTKDKLN